MYIEEIHSLNFSSKGDFMITHSFAEEAINKIKNIHIFILFQTVDKVALVHAYQSHFSFIE